MCCHSHSYKQSCCFSFSFVVIFCLNLMKAFVKQTMRQLFMSIFSNNNRYLQSINISYVYYKFVYITQLISCTIYYKVRGDVFKSKQTFFANFIAISLQKSRNINFLFNVLVEGNPGLFSEDRQTWHNDLIGNHNCFEPRILNSQYIKHLLPNVKVIIIYRDPVDR